MDRRDARLLLLGPPPMRGSIEAYREKYGPILKHALCDASKSSNRILEIAILCPSAIDGKNLNFDFYQSALAHIYRLGCETCSENGIDPVKPNYVDVQVYFIGQRGHRTEATRVAGPVYSFTSFSNGPRKWELADIDGSEATEEYLHDWLHLQTSLTQNLSVAKPRHFSGGSQTDPAKAGCDLDPEATIHDTVIVGGTFDNLHEGHKLLLSATALVLCLAPPANSKKQRLIVGITGDQLLVNKKYSEALESWDERQKSVFDFLRSIVSLDDADINTVPEVRDEPGPNGKARIYHLNNGPTIECVEIQDPFGPTITEESISALVVSGESRAGGKACNDKRIEKGWAALQVFEVDVLGPQGSSDLQDKISSTEKRRRKMAEAASQSK